MHKYLLIINQGDQDDHRSRTERLDHLGEQLPLTSAELSRDRRTGDRTNAVASATRPARVPAQKAQAFFSLRIAERLLAEDEDADAPNVAHKASATAKAGKWERVLPQAMNQYP